MQEKYFPKKIEKYVQQYWKKNKIFKVFEDASKEKYYCLSMMPYPSGNLHIGHVRNYTIGDVIARYQRMLGKNVLYPIGWDAFGLPAENAALINNTTPDIWTYKNIQHMKKQLTLLGFSYDWSREITTCKSEYYHWEQLLFIKLYKKGLAYKKNSLINWCDKDKTVLANEQVINNKCWRCNNIVKLKKIPQWFLKITNYAEELLNDLDKLKEWPKEVITMQRNWIGRSEGIEIQFKLINDDDKLKIYTTRPDTIMGITYLAVSIEHSIAKKQSKKYEKIKKFIDSFKLNINNKEKIKKDKKGIYANLYAIHPLTKEHIPIWISNYVNINYGTGAIIGVPAHNQCDWEFAKKYNLKIKPVLLNNKDKEPNIQDKAELYKGILFNSGKFSNLSNLEGYNAIIYDLESNGIGKKKINYKLKDWCVSRQRFWGTPIPMIITKNKTMPVPEEELPILLSKQKTIKINNIIYKLESDTFDTFIESSWYYLRYTCPNYSKGIIDSNKANYWLPIDQYIGGIEHAILHLMYFRFFHKLLRDIGLLKSDEPAKKLLCQGMVVSNTFYYIDENNNVIWVDPNDVDFKINEKGEIIDAKNYEGKDLIYAGMSKMSKSKNNGINPQKLIDQYGADTLRLFIMFASPPNIKLEWKESGIKGISRFLNKLWNLAFQHINKGIIKDYNILNKYKLNNKQKEIRKMLHKTILKVDTDIKKRQTFNTAIAAIMELTNQLIIFEQKLLQDRIIMQESLQSIVLMLSPFTPHICFILWKELGGKGIIDYATWPKLDNSAIFEKKILLIIQINGKKRSIVSIPKYYTKNQIFDYVKKHESIKKYLFNSKIKKIIFIPNKIINLLI